MIYTLITVKGLIFKVKYVDKEMKPCKEMTRGT